MTKCVSRSPTAIRRPAYQLGWSRTRGSTSLPPMWSGARRSRRSISHHPTRSGAHRSTSHHHTRWGARRSTSHHHTWSGARRSTSHYPTWSGARRSTSHHHTRSGARRSTSHHHTWSGAGRSTSHYPTWSGARRSTSHHHTRSGAHRSTSHHHTRSGARRSTSHHHTWSGARRSTSHYPTWSGARRSTSHHPTWSRARRSTSHHPIWSGARRSTSAPRTRLGTRGLGVRSPTNQRRVVAARCARRFHSQFLPRRHQLGIFIAEGLQPVPAKLAERIWSWEFVDMADLLPEHMAPKKEESALSSLFPARKRKQVTDINQWLQCLITYVSVMSRRFPHDVVELMAYMAGIHRASMEFAGPGWIRYDFTFRTQAAASGYRRWSSINASLYTLCFTGKAAAKFHCEFCFSVVHAAQDCLTTTDDLDVACGWRMVKSVVAAVSANPPDQRPSVPDQRPSVPDQRSNASDPRSEQVCLLYNSSRCMYAKCRRRHVCSSCAGSHLLRHVPVPARICPVTSHSHSSDPGA